MAWQHNHPLRREPHEHVAVAGTRAPRRRADAGGRAADAEVSDLNLQVHIGASIVFVTGQDPTQIPTPSPGSRRRVLPNHVVECWTPRQRADRFS